jgi:hypothetical protein
LIERNHTFGCHTAERAGLLRGERRAGTQ